MNQMPTLFDDAEMNTHNSQNEPLKKGVSKNKKSLQKTFDFVEDTPSELSKTKKKDSKSKSKKSAEIDNEAIQFDVNNTPSLAEDEVASTNESLQIVQTIDDYLTHYQDGQKVKFSDEVSNTTENMSLKVAQKTPAPEAATQASLIDDNWIKSLKLDDKEAHQPLPIWQLEDRYYSIGEVATLFAVNISHIRFWTTEFNMRVRTTRKGDRLYNQNDIAKLRLIHHLVKVNKHTTQGAKERLKLNRKEVATKVLLKSKLESLKERLITIKNSL